MDGADAIIAHSPSVGHHRAFVVEEYLLRRHAVARRLATSVSVTLHAAGGATRVVRVTRQLRQPTPDHFPLDEAAPEVGVILATGNRAEFGAQASHRRRFAAATLRLRDVAPPQPPADRALLVGAELAPAHAAVDPAEFLLSPRWRHAARPLPRNRPGAHPAGWRNWHCRPSHEQSPKRA
eukprot:gene7023-18305_t